MGMKLVRNWLWVYSFVNLFSIFMETDMMAGPSEGHDWTVHLYLFVLCLIGLMIYYTRTDPCQEENEESNYDDYDGYIENLKEKEK